MKNEKEQQQQKQTTIVMKVCCLAIRHFCLQFIPFKASVCIFFLTEKRWVGAVHIFCVEKNKRSCHNFGIQFQII